MEAVTAAEAPDDQHGGQVGHLPGRQKNMRLLGKLDLADGIQGSVTDVDAHKGFAYLGTDYAMCPEEGGTGTGVHVVDIRRPRNPRKVAFIPAGARVGEGIHVLHVDTRSFTGDLLLFSNESCSDDRPGGGISIVDVSDPRNPKMLADQVGDTDANDPEDPTPLEEPNDVHSVMGWDAGKRAYAILTDNFEFLDVDIMDISNPRAPTLIAETGYDEWPGISPQLAHGDLVLHHDMWVKKIGGDWFAMVSYWDAGWVLLNLNNPAEPVFVKDSDYQTPDPLAPAFQLPEGNAHQGTWSSNNRFFVGTDEDFAPFRIQRLSITSGPNAGDFDAAAVGGGAAPNTLPDQVMNGPTVYGGYGCPPETYEGSTPVPQRSDFNLDLQRGEEAILVLQRGPVEDPSEPTDPCFPGEKAAEAIEAGWDAVLIVQRHLGDPELDSAFCGSGGYPADAPPIVTACTTHTAFHHIFNSPPAYDLPYDPAKEPDIGDVGERISTTGDFDGWGYAHLLNARTLQEIDVYAPPEVHDPRFALQNFGDLTAHEVETDRRRGVNLAYFSWYSAGARVTKFGAKGFREVGVYIDPHGNNFWGVDTVKRGKKRPILLFSDRDFGLFVLKYTGPQ